MISKMGQHFIWYIHFIPHLSTLRLDFYSEPLAVLAGNNSCRADMKSSMRNPGR